MTTLDYKFDVKRKVWIPREYQPLMIDHVVEIPRCGVFARMGLGKTVAILSALDLLHMRYSVSLPSLVLAPLRVANTTWPNEAKKWEHLAGTDVYPIALSADMTRSADENRRYEVARKAFGKAIKTGNHAVFTLNYENIPWLIQWLIDDNGKVKWPFGTVVADESTKLKSYRSRQGGARTRQLSLIAHKYCSRWINATGSPTPNGLKDLWGQTWFLDGGQRLGTTYDAFSKRWFYRSFDGKSILPHPFAQQQITDKIKDICISLDPADYFDLDKPIETIVAIDLPEKARKHYRELERQMFTQIENDFARHDVEALNAASRTNKCLQLAAGFAYIDNEEGDERKAKKWIDVHDQALDALDDIIEEAGGMPILVCYHFKADLARLKKRYPKGRVFDTNPNTELMWNMGQIPIMFIHAASAAHGSNLQDGGNILVFYSFSWDWEHIEQVIERIGPVRQMQSGHKRPVFLYWIMARGTMQYDVKRRLGSKETVQNALMKALKAYKARNSP